MGEPRTIDNPPAEDTALGILGLQAKEQRERQGELDEAMLFYSALAIIQMLIYWDRHKDYVEKRDCAIGEEFVPEDKGLIGFLAQLESYRDEDWKTLGEKASIKDKIKFDEWKPKYCENATLYQSRSNHDSQMIDRFEQMFSETAIDGVPEGWSIHDGSLAFGLGASFSGPLYNIAQIEMFERFKADAIAIVQQAQMSMKAIYNASAIMKYYEQVIGIYEGFATMYMQGFNSAGAMLGTSLGKLFSAAPGSGSSTTFNSSSVSGSSSSVHPVGMIGGVI